MILLLQTVHSLGGLLGSKKDKQIFIPRPWFGPTLAHIDTEGYYYPGMTAVDREIVRV